MGKTFLKKVKIVFNLNYLIYILNKDKISQFFFFNVVK